MDFVISFCVRKSNKFFNKFFKFGNTILIILLYALSITALPIITNANKRVPAAVITIDTVTYINNGQMLARQIDNNNLQFYISDAKGSVLKLNNSDGSNAQNYSYAAYGNIIDAPILLPQKVAQAQQSNINEKSSRTLHTLTITKVNSLPATGNTDINIPNSFQYNAERFDNNTDLQYLRARFYNLKIKRFLNQDSYDLLNKFNYVDGNPIMKIDPSGHDAINDNWDFITAVAVAGSLVVSIIGILTRHFYNLRDRKVTVVTHSIAAESDEEVTVTTRSITAESGYILSNGTSLKSTLKKQKPKPIESGGESSVSDDNMSNSSASSITATQSSEPSIIMDPAITSAPLLCKPTKLKKVTFNEILTTEAPPE